jgi:hypothetical protein
MNALSMRRAFYPVIGMTLMGIFHGTIYSAPGGGGTSTCHRLTVMYYMAINTSWHVPE